MNKPRIHAELIKAWADGAIIQEFIDGGIGAYWKDMIDKNPSWHPNCDFRIKPEPGPDIVTYIEASIDEITWHKDTGPQNGMYQIGSNIKIVFDGKTKKLKSVEMIK